MAIDYLGNEVHVGDTVVMACRDNCYPYLSKYKVVEVEGENVVVEIPCIIWRYPGADKEYKRKHLVKYNDRLVVIKKTRDEENTSAN